MEKPQLLVRALGIAEETPDLERDFSIYSLMNRDEVSDIAVALYALVVDAGSPVNPFEDATSSEEAVYTAILELMVLDMIEIISHTGPEHL